MLHMIWATVLLVICMSLAVVAVGQVVYHEKFDHYGVDMPGFSDACVMAEYPPSLKHMEFRPTKREHIYTDGFFKLPTEAQGLTNYECEFKFRFLRDKPKAFDFRIEFLVDDSGKQPKYAGCTVKVNEQWCLITAGDVSPRLPAPRIEIKNTPFNPFMGGYFYRGLVRVQGKRLEAFIEGMGHTVRIGAVEVSGSPLAGFNFSGNAPFDIDDIIVRKISPLPVGDFRDEDGAKIANHTAEYMLPVPAGANTASARVRLGHPGEMRIHLNWDDDSTTPIAVTTFDNNVTVPVIKDVLVTKDGKQVMERKQMSAYMSLPDAGLNFREITEKRTPDDWRLSCNIRPWISGYLDDDKQVVAANWEQYEAASAHFFTFEVRRVATGIEYWVDGRYSGRRDTDLTLKDIVFVLPADGAIKDAWTAKIARDSEYLPLDITHIANPGVMASAQLPVKTGETTIKGIPFQVAPGTGNLDLSVVKENFGSWALEVDFYLSRSAFSGMPETLMLSVPNVQYHKAYILCAVADDPERDPILTARLTRFLHVSTGGRGPAIADTTIKLPRNNEQLPQGVTLLGAVEYTDANRKHQAPLYLVEVPIDCGKIQDVIFEEKIYQMIPQPYLDFEVLGKTVGVLQQLNKEHKPDPLSKSAVHVFGVTLVKSPVEMQVAPAREGNAYTSDEKPAITVTLRSKDEASYRMAWTASDVDGKVVDSGEAKGSFKQAGEEKQITVSPKLNSVGHYTLAFRLFKDKELLIEHNVSLAVVAPDTRKAGYESPYFAWWFNGAHLTCSDINVVGPLLKMAGIRRTLLKNEEDGKPWMLTTGQIGNFTASVSPEAMEQKKVEYEKKLDAVVEAFPHVNAANIFHESLNGPFPLELYNIQMPLPDSEWQLQGQKNLVNGAMLTARLYREKYPNIRPTLVNTGDSLGGAGLLMRHKMPKELITALGDEALGQTVPPEMHTAYNAWMLKELARKMGYGDVPIDACYEWKGRNIRDLGERKTAAWRIRDALIAHAWNYKMIPIPGVIEPSNSYHNSVWGDDWMFSRSPQNYPHISYSTTAHLTRVLDCATFSRQLDTGTITVYALEFKRGNQLVYALWTVRGTADLSLTFARDVTVQHSDMLGRGKDMKTAGKSLALTVSGEPCYLEASAPIQAVTVVKRAYPEDQLPAGATVQVADKMDMPEAWQLIDKPDARLENVPQLGNESYLTFRKFGKYQMRAVKDEERGDCLEIELMQEGDIIPFLAEYTILKLKTPAPINGTPTTVGVWVKGNSGWGQLMWEFEDAEGERWLSCGTGGYWCDIYDWPKQASINFDGWNFVQFPITQQSPIHLPNPGEVSQQWRSSGGGNSRIDYPITLTGLAVNMTRQALNLTEMVPVNTVIRLSNLSAY